MTNEQIEFIRKIEPSETLMKYDGQYIFYIKYEEFERLTTNEANEYEFDDVEFEHIDFYSVTELECNDIFDYVKHLKNVMNKENHIADLDGDERFNDIVDCDCDCFDDLISLNQHDPVFGKIRFYKLKPIKLRK